MVYLSTVATIVHRDLASRNLLVSSPNDNTTEENGKKNNNNNTNTNNNNNNNYNSSLKVTVKVADFGLSRLVKDEGYYKSDSKAIPYKW